MAIWQYTFHVLPKESIKILSSDYNCEKNEEGLDDEPLWKLNPVNKLLFDSIKEILPKNRSWSNEIELYGNQDSNCFEILFDNKSEVISASFRIDFRNSYYEILNQIVEFCILNGLVMLNEDLNVVPLNSEQLQKTIEDSIQMRRYKEISSKDMLE